MRVVVEEVTAEQVCLIPDKQAKALYVNRSDLPQSIQIGDVIDIVLENGKVVSAQVVPLEKKKRLEENRLKREKLLKRKKK